MIAGALVLRPEPGNARTVERLAALGIAARSVPLFAVRPVVWQAPDPAGYDALLLTSANAVRHAGGDFHVLRGLPVVAVGEATAEAATRAGLAVTLVGTADAAAAVGMAREKGLARLLHLAGRERAAVPDLDARIVYASEQLPIAPGLLGAGKERTALLHSPRAAARFAALVDRDGLDRSVWTVAGLSAAVAAAAGGGWRRVVVAPLPTDASLLATLCGD